jgi:tetratricopeptide (TPR) repeat protein
MSALVGPARRRLGVGRGSSCVAVLALALCAASGAARAQSGPTAAREADLARIERDLGVADGEIRRIEEQYRTVPDLFTSEDRNERVTWGEIYYLTREYQRASMLLFGALEPRENDTRPVEQRPDYADALYYLADSLYLLGNHAAAQGYFERLLTLRGHGHHEQAILRLMEIGDAAGRFDDVDRYYAQYLQTAGANVPGQVRYLRGKSLFLAKKDAAAIDELRQVPAIDAYALRSRYLIGASLVRQGRYEDALTMFQQVAFAKPIAKDDKRVKEQAHLARGRLFYETDRLGESIDAYQEIDWDSSLLTTMLYEVTWTYVRRGQIALRGNKDDNLTDLERRERAKVEYEKALLQLDDLKALEPDSDRMAEIDILAGNLRLQRNEFERAEHIFGEVLDSYQAADAQLTTLIADRSTRERLLSDILQMSSGGLTVDSKLPALAARRAAKNEEVAKALQVFKDIQRSREDIESTARLLASLEEQLAPENPSRTELFKPLQAGVERSTSLENTLLGLKQNAVAVERALARPDASTQARLARVRADRAALERKVAALPRTAEAVGARRAALLGRLERIDQLLHQAELEARQRRAELTAIDFMYSRSPASPANPTKGELRKNQVRKERGEVDELERRVEMLKGRIAELKKGIAVAGGRGTSEDLLRQAYARSFEEERAILAGARDPAQRATYARLDAAVARIEELTRQNHSFRARLDGIVEERLAGARALLAAQKEAISTFTSALGDIDGRAAAVRDKATTIALEKVRYELNRIVLRADVGIVDTSFARKQAETEKIGQLQRARAAELTDLTQAYADLTKDEVP